MESTQFETIINKLDNIYAILAVQNIKDRDEKIYALKQFGFGFKEIGPIVGMKDVRKTEGWKRK